MAFDQTQDKELANGLAYSDEDTRIYVSVHIYNGGKEKIQISRHVFTKREGWKPTKTGRLTPEEFVHAMNTGTVLLQNLNLIPVEVLA